MNTTLTDIRSRMGQRPASGYEDGYPSLLMNSQDDVRWLAIGYAMTVDILWSGYEATQGKRMPASERAELLQLWGVSEEDIAWAKQQKDDPRAAA